MRCVTLGDYLGGILGPILSFLALIALLFTLVLQNRELRNSSAELANSARALEEQSKAFQLQNFERTFFEMVRLHGDIVKDIDLRDKEGNITTQGRDCFRVFYDKRLRNKYKEIIPENRGYEKDSLEHLQKMYDSFFDSYQHEIGHYFRNLYHIVNYIEESKIEQKKKYFQIIRAQLSSFELLLLFYNSLHPISAKLKIKLEKFAILHNINLDKLFNTAHIAYYKESAFGNRDLTKYKPNA